MAMRTMTNNPYLIKRTILAMLLALIKNFHVFVPNNTAPNRVITRQATTTLMYSTEGDVDVHSHVVTIATTMMT